MESMVIQFFRNNPRSISLSLLAISLFLMVGAIFWLQDNRAASLNLSDADGLFDDDADLLANRPYVPGATASGITGMPCDDYNVRPLAIMYDGLPSSRSLTAGITDASFVVEMAHRYPSGATQLMGVFDCEKPFLVGPLGSGRVDFLSIARSFDAIYVPSGGDQITGSLLTEGVQNHIDCAGLYAPAGSDESCFVRDDVEALDGTTSSRPFANTLRLQGQARDVGYTLERDASTLQREQIFLHSSDRPRDSRPVDGVLEIEYQEGFDVTYVYDQRFNRYERFFAGEPEFDVITGRRVAPRNVIVLKAAYEPLTTQRDYVAEGLRDPWTGLSEAVRFEEDSRYANFELGDAWFDTSNSGWAHFYVDGQEIIGSWRRAIEDPRAPLEFYNGSGEQIRFVPGQIWMHVLEPSRTFRWL